MARVRLSSFSLRPLYTAPGSDPPCPASIIMEYGMSKWPSLHSFSIRICKKLPKATWLLRFKAVLFCADSTLNYENVFKEETNYEKKGFIRNYDRSYGSRSCRYSNRTRWRAENIQYWYLPVSSARSTGCSNTGIWRCSKRRSWRRKRNIWWAECTGWFRNM